MSIKFDFGKFVNSMQKMSQDLCNSGMLIAASRTPMRGMYGPSIWGCMGGLQGNMPIDYMGMGGFNSLYTSPYMVPFNQQDIDAQFDRAYRNALSQQLAPTIEKGKSFDDTIREGQDYTFVPQGWEEQSKKEDLSDTERKNLTSSYNSALINTSRNYLEYLDSQYGDIHGDLDINEYTSYLIDKKYGKGATLEQQAVAKEFAQKAFEKLDTDGDGKINYKEMAAALACIDSEGTGKISATAFNDFMDKLAEEDNDVTQQLTDKKKELFNE